MSSLIKELGLTRKVVSTIHPMRSENEVQLFYQLLRTKGVTPDMLVSFDECKFYANRTGMSLLYGCVPIRSRPCSGFRVAPCIFVLLARKSVCSCPTLVQWFLSDRLFPPLRYALAGERANALRGVPRTGYAVEVLAAISRDGVCPQWPASICPLR